MIFLGKQVVLALVMQLYMGLRMVTATYIIMAMGVEGQLILDLFKMITLWTMALAISQTIQCRTQRGMLYITAEFSLSIMQQYIQHPLPLLHCLLQQTMVHFRQCHMQQVILLTR